MQILSFFLFVPLIYLMFGAALWFAFNAVSFAAVDPHTTFLSATWTTVTASSAFHTVLHAPWQYEIRLLVPFVLAVVLAGVLALGLQKQEKERRTGKIVHLRGRQYVDQPAKAAKLFGQENLDADGLQINPTLPPINKSKEGEHFIFVGGVGSGKTQTLIKWIFAALARNDAVLIHDTKGDFTSFIPQPMILIAPWDGRSWLWDVAADVKTKAAAREFAAGLIKESQGSPMFSNAARQVLVGCIVCLQQTRPGKWGFRDLAQMCAQEQPDLLRIMQAFNPEGIRSVQDANVTTAGILINLSAYLAPIYDLAEAWPSPEAAGKKRFSVRAWLAGDVKTGEGKTPTVILQNNKSMGEIASALHAAVIRIAAQFICSPEMPETKTRRIWMMLDEFPQLGKIEAIGSVLDVGRSKGMRVVLLSQSLEQIKNIFGAELAKSWAALVGTMIVGRTQNETAKSIADYAIGKREIERHSVSYSNNLGGGRGNGSRSNSASVQTVDVVLPSQLLADLGPNKVAGGVRILWLTGKYALRLHIPFSSPEILRPASVPAKWVTAGAYSDRVRIYDELNAVADATAAEKAEAAAKRKGGGVQSSRMADTAAPVPAPADEIREQGEQSPEVEENPADKTLEAPANQKSESQLGKLASQAADAVPDDVTDQLLAAILQD